MSHVADDQFQSFNVFLDTQDPEPKAPLVLTKILASAFTIHGNHFTVLKHLHPNDAEQFHTDSIASISRKVATYAKQERMAKSTDVKARYAKKRAQCLTIYKCLILLLGPVNGRGALAIKASLGEGLKVAGVEPTPNKMWEAYRAYEKRLVLIASKDSNIRAGASRLVKEAEEHGDEEEQDDEERTERSPSPSEGRGVVQAEEVAVMDDDDDDGIDVDPDLNFDLELDQNDSASMLGSPSVTGRKRSATVTTPNHTQPSKKSKK
jgi:cohesin complex subunit SA-1/2